jgi:hypothetical protein
MQIDAILDAPYAGAKHQAIRLYEFVPADENPQVQTLIDNAFDGQWKPDEQIDWSTPAEIPTAMSKATYVGMVSQFYYAEEATIMAIGQLLQQVPEFQARRYLCTQALEEARHAQIYRRYLDLIGGLAPVDEGLKRTYEACLVEGVPYWAKIAVLNVMFEGEALKHQRKRIETLPCPLFRQVNAAIILDEARHHAFGKVYLRAKLKQISLAEKVSAYHWIQHIWSIWAGAIQARNRGQDAAILRTSSSELDERFKEQQKAFIDIGLYDPAHADRYAMESP